MKESELEKLCLSYISQYPTILCKKIKAGGQKHSSGGKQFFKKSSIPGFSDLHICSKGRAVYVELKTEIGRLSESQKIFQREVENSGGLYYVIRSINEFKNLVELIK